MKRTTSKERIGELMAYFGINQTELCRRTGVQKSAISNYLNGDREPRQDQISLIVDPFNVNPAWLMGYDVPMFIEPAAPVGQCADIVLTDLETELVRAFRNASPDLRSAACAVLGIKGDAESTTGASAG